MQVSFKTPDNAIEFQFDAQSSREAFEKMANISELFPLENCGKCSSSNVKPVVRKTQGYEFFEIRCVDCGHSLSYGQTREDKTLFPKRKDKAGEWLQNRGWQKYQGTADASNEISW